MLVIPFDNSKSRRQEKPFPNVLPNNPINNIIANCKKVKMQFFIENNCLKSHYMSLDKILH